MKRKRSSSVFLLIIALLVQGQMQISFASGSTIEGIVVDAYTNSPISFARVDIGTGNTWFEHDLGSTATDANGRYSIRVPMSDHYQLRVHTQEITRGQYRFYDHCWNRRTIPYALVIHADFALEPAGSIIVKMFDSGGKRLDANSIGDSWVKELRLARISGEEMDNRTWGYPTGEERVLLSPEGVPTMLVSEIAVPSVDRLSIRIDNESDGFTMRRAELLLLNLNYEAAKATYRNIRNIVESLISETPTLRESVSDISRNLDEAKAHQLQGDDEGCAVLSNAALLEILRLRDEVWLQIPFEMDHPRLLFNRSDLAAIKIKIGSAFPQQVWKRILMDCNEFLTLAPPQLHDVSTYEYGDWVGAGDTAVMRMHYLSFVYLMTGDTKYADKAKEIMWAVFSWNSWIDPVEEAEGGHIPDLMAGRTTAGIAITYDWLFDYLTPEERTLVQRRLGEKGAGPLYQASVSGVWWSSSSHNNHNAITHAGLGLAGLAFLGEHPDASKWIGLAASRLWKYFDSGGSNGGWGEGLHYWWYGLAHGVLFADALRKVTGVDLYQSDFLRETVYFPMYLLTPGLKAHVNFGDSWLGSEDISWIAALTLRLSSEYQNGYGQTFFCMLAERYTFWLSPTDANLWALIWHDDSVKTKPLEDLPLSRLFEGLGWVIVRSGWGPQDTLLAFKSGPNWNHGHADQNNFIFEAFGQPLLVDLGAAFYSVEYFTSHASIDYHMASIGHNVILIDGLGQVDPRSGWSHLGPPNGEIVSFQTYAGFESYEHMVGDASAAYPIPVRFIRQMVFVQHRFLIVVDTVEATNPSRFQWLAHTTGQLESEGNEFRIEKDGVVLMMKFLLPENFDSRIYNDQKRQIDWSNEEPAPRLEVSNRAPALATTFLAVLYPMNQGDAPPRIFLSQNGTTWTVKIEAGNERHNLFFNSTTSPPRFLATTSQVISLQQTVQNLLKTAGNLLEEAKRRSFDSPQALALVKSAEFHYREALNENESGSYEKAATLTQKSITELTNAFTLDTSWKQERRQTLVLIMGMAAVVSSLILAGATLHHRRKRRS